jgi:hypothetical protein
MRSPYYIFLFALVLPVTSSAQAHGRGFAWFFAHSRPGGNCSGQPVVATYYTSGRRTASGQALIAADTPPRIACSLSDRG